MATITKILDILGLTTAEYASLCSTCSDTHLTKPLKYPLKTLKAAMLILTKDLIILSASNFKQYQDEIILFFILAKNHPTNDTLFQVKIIAKITRALYNNAIYQSKDFLKLILAMNYNIKYKYIVDSVRHVKNKFTKQEILDIFGKNIKSDWIFDYTTTIDQKKEWLPLFLTNYIDDKLIICNIYTYDKNRDYKLYLQIEKFQKTENILYLICDPNISDELIENVFEKTRIDLLNDASSINVIFNANHLTFIKTLDTTLFNERLYLKIIDEKIWDNNKRYSEKLFKFAFDKEYYTIIIDHLNKDIPIDNINAQIAQLFKFKNYKNIEMVLKNCGTYDMQCILDALDNRKTFDTVFCEFCINYISKEKINLNLLKKFFRLGTYIENLDRFSIPYDENLYKLCHNYNIYPNEYMNKMKNIKLTDILEKEIKFKKGTHPHSIYTILKQQLFNNEYKVLPIDDIILNYIDTYLEI